MIRRLRALLVKHQVEHQRFDLNEAVGDVASILRAEARRRGATLEILLPMPAVTMVGDRIQIQQVLINLVLNALEAVAGSARSAAPGQRDGRQDRRTASRWWCRIGGLASRLNRCPGCSIPFSAQNPPAWGWGCRSCAPWSRRMAAASRPRTGLTGARCFALNCRRPGTTQGRFSKAGMKDKNAPPLIHVIDDDDSLRTALLRLLDAAGFEARGYASAGEFLLHPVPDRPGCLLLDVRMPGPSGLDLQAALPGHGLNLPVIFMTGHADVPSTVRAMKAGAVDFLEKPVQRAEPAGCDRARAGAGRKSTLGARS